MSGAYVSQNKLEQLSVRMKKLAVHDKDIVERFILGSGKGGQKVNKTSSCVYLKHIPTGIEVKWQSARSRSLNRFCARKELCDRIEEREHGVKTARKQKQEKIRRQKRRRSRRQKAIMLDDKHKQGMLKKSRKRVDVDHD